MDGGQEAFRVQPSGCVFRYPHRRFPIASLASYQPGKLKLVLCTPVGSLLNTSPRLDPRRLTRL
jgi:hypothetical protein